MGFFNAYFFVSLFLDIIIPHDGPHPQDVFVHYDYMVLADPGTACELTTDCDARQSCVDHVCRGHSHAPDRTGIRAVVEAFAAHGIRLHVDRRHRAIPEQAVVTLPFYAAPACSGPDAVTLR